MHAIQRFLVDDSGNAMMEYAIVFLVFALAACLSMYGIQNQAGSSLVNTRARMVCNSVTLRSNVVTTVDGSGNITCT